MREIAASALQVGDIVEIGKQGGEVSLETVTAVRMLELDWMRVSTRFDCFVEDRARADVTRDGEAHMFVKADDLFKLLNR